LNGADRARVVRRECQHRRRWRRADRVYQTIAPNFAGNAPTRDEVLQIAVLTKQAAVDAVRELQRRRG
jgi:hypothetical protein